MGIYKGNKSLWERRREGLTPENCGPKTPEEIKVVPPKLETTNVAPPKEEKVETLPEDHVHSTVVDFGFSPNPKGSEIETLPEELEEIVEKADKDTRSALEKLIKPKSKTRSKKK